MKAKDLMIGDWVKNDLGEIQQVVEIRDNEKIMLAYNDFYSADELEPIPLTAEILEKNFEKKTFYGIYDDYFDLDIREYSDSIYVATFHNCEMNTPDQQMTFSFVHELQHFLNHCGIEKEIEL